MIRRPAAIVAIALAVSLAGGAAVFAQQSDDYASNAGNHEASGAGSDGNVVVSGGRRLPENLPVPVGPGESAAPSPTPAPSGPPIPGEVVIPPNPARESAAVTSASEPGAVPVTVTEETTSGESVIGPAPEPAPEPSGNEAVTADDSAGSSGAGESASTGNRRTGEASVSAEDGTSTGGSINEVIPPTTGTTPPSGASSPSTSSASSSGSSRRGGGACGYPTWLDAQTALESEWSVELADALDPDRDGIACEEAMD